MTSPKLPKPGDLKSAAQAAVETAQSAVETAQAVASSAMLIAALGTHCPELSVLGVEAGLHVAILLPREHDDRRVSELLAAQGFVIEALSLYPGAADREINGLAVGFALIDRVSANGLAIHLAGALG